MTHLYQPRAIYDWSIMPAYPYLFEVKDKAAPGDVVVALPERYAPKGKVVVARPQARDLVAYLRSLDRTFPAPPTAVRDDGYSEKGEPK